MPQLDFYAFENQIIYLIIFFFLFVNFFSYFFLPDVFISLKARFLLFKEMEERNLSLQVAETKLRASTNFFFDFSTNFSFIYKLFSKLLQSIWNVYFLVYPDFNQFFSYSFLNLNYFFFSYISLPFSFPFSNFFVSLNDFFFLQAQNNKLSFIK